MTLPSVFSILRYFWQLLLNSLGRLLLMYFRFLPWKFFSAVTFCKVTLNVNKNFLKIALLEPTPYKISINVSFFIGSHWFSMIQPMRINKQFPQLITCQNFIQYFMYKKDLFSCSSLVIHILKNKLCGWLNTNIQFF